MGHTNGGQSTSGDPKILRLLDRAAQVSAFIGMLVLLFISLAVTANVLMRWLFGSPLNGVGDLSGLATIIAISAALPLCLTHQGNINVDLLGKAMGGPINRTLDAFGAFVLLLFVAGIAWQLVGFAQGKMTAGETTWILGWKVAPWWWAAVGWFWLSVLCQAAVLYRIVFPGTGADHD